MYSLQIQTPSIEISDQHSEQWLKAIHEVKKKHPERYQLLIIIPEKSDFKSGQLPLLLNLIQQEEMVPVGFQSNQEDIHDVCRKMNVPVFWKEEIQSHSIENKKQSIVYVKQDILKNETHHFDKNVVILGKIGKNAQVTCNQSIYVCGLCQGSVFAGIQEKSSFLFFQSWQDSRIGVSKYFLEKGEAPKHLKKKTVILYTKNQSLHIQRLT